MIRKFLLTLFWPILEPIYRRKKARLERKVAEQQAAVELLTRLVEEAEKDAAASPNEPPERRQ